MAPSAARSRGIRKGKGSGLKLATKNWNEFQHYKDRNPTWIKLHKKLLDDFDFQCLPIASKALAPMLWLIASENDRGEIDASYEKLAFRLRMTAQEVESGLGPLIGKGFFEVLAFDEIPASNPLAERQQLAIPENINPTEKKHLRVVADTAFVRFWETWPKSPRKVAKPKCCDVWKSRRLDAIADKIIAHVTAMKETEQWRKGFEPAPLTYLNQRRWEDADAGGGPNDDFAGAV